MTKPQFLINCHRKLELIRKRNGDEMLFQCVMLHKEVKDYLRTFDQFKARTSAVLDYPEINTDSLFVCDVCGLSDCQSDHK